VIEWIEHIELYILTEKRGEVGQIVLIRIIIIIIIIIIIMAFRAVVLGCAFISRLCD